MFQEKLSAEWLWGITIACVVIYVIILAVILIRTWRDNRKHGHPPMMDIAFESIMTTIISGVAVGFVFIGAHGIFNITHSTDKISEAQGINDDEFRNKIIEVSQIDSLKTEDNSEWVDKGPKVSDFKSGGFYEISGLKDGQKVNLVVFFKGDKMNVTVETPDNKAVKVEKYSYVPQG